MVVFTIGNCKVEAASWKIKALLLSLAVSSK